MNSLLKIPYLLTLIGVVLGAGGGFLYWNFVGCSSGTCAITSVWYNSTAYGALMGGLIINSFSSSKKGVNKDDPES